MSAPRYECVIGLECHVQLATRSKIFSGASTRFGAEPNTQACAVDLAMPGTLPVLNREALRMACDVLDALQVAHHAGVVHRDFKPDNVLLGRDGRVRVTDFGVARLTTLDAAPTEKPDLSGLSMPIQGSGLHTPLTLANSLIGTPRYMAPEQFDGRVTDARTDQFSFCVALYQALYGQEPFAGDTLAKLVESWKLEPSLRQVETLALYTAEKLGARGLLDRIGLEGLTTNELNECIVTHATAYLAALFSICMLCHGEMVRRRPASKWLTSFYMMTSAGGGYFRHGYWRGSVVSTNGMSSSSPSWYMS